MTQAAAQSQSQPSSTGDGRGGPVVVVGLDGSPSSWDAFAWAAGQAARCHGRLITVYAAPLIEPGAAMGAPMDYAAVEQVRTELAGQLKDEAEQQARQIDVPISFVRENGEAAHALISVARSTHADLIVVGKSAKMLHHIAGSLGRRLVSRHDSPVTVVVP